ncbi:MAG: hypothetical protein C0404_01300 [Verrucomicrobia bacterium]|nr:hypothetical protein [Verrucomicrobiota bacterium]
MFETNGKDTIVKNEFGHFSADGSEYIITTPATPRPWFNRFGNTGHSVIISHTGGGYAIAGDKHRFQLNWYIPRYDESGRYIYLRDDQSGEFWAASFAPVKKTLTRFECRHGQAWTTFLSEKNGIACEYTVFVPVDGPVELWHVVITNRSKRTRRITATPFVEWSIDDGPQGVDDLVYAAHTDAGFDAANQAVWAACRQTTKFRFFRAFLAGDFRPDAWETNRTAFVGRARTLANPQEIEHGRLSCTPCESEVAMGAISRKLRLAPGASVSFNVMAGMAQTGSERGALRRKFLAKGRPEKELARLKAFWARMPERFEIHTPDRELDRYVNRCLVAHVYKQGASNAVRPIRIQLRNQMQDVLGMVALAPEHARRLILKLMNFHCSSGDALQWLSYGAEWRQIPEHVDTKLWIVYSTAAYLRETGDFDILRQRERFYDVPKRVSLLEMIGRAVEKSWKDRGVHGLSLLGRGDWNDSLDGMGRAGKGESVWMSEALHLALLDYAGILEQTGDSRRAGHMRTRAKELHKAINRHGWDGGWYLMGYTDAGHKVGTHTAKEGRVFLMTQLWAVLSGVATPERQKKIFKIIDTRLETKYGVMLNDKTFTKPDPSIGTLTFLQQGLNENGAIYVHSNAFKLCADGLAGRGDELYAGLRKQFPCFHDPDVTACEPFVLPNYYRPPALPRKFGATHRAWVTTAPSWFLMAVGEGLMGFRTTYNGIEVNPSIPRKWKRAFFRRRMNGTTYELEILNPARAGHGVKELWIDGAKLKGNVLPKLTDGSTHKVKVVLGR